MTDATLLLIIHILAIAIVPPILYTFYKTMQR